MPPRSSLEPSNNKVVNEGCVEFDFDEEIEEYGFYLCLGRRRSGKSTYMRLVSQHLTHAQHAQHIVIAGNENIKEQWSTIVHPFYIHDPSVALLKSIIDEQNRRVRECRALNVTFPKEWEIVLWIDDCGPIHEFMHSKPMKWISSNGRQIKAWVFLIIQKLTHAPTECRENPDGIFVLNTQHEPTMKLLRNECASSVPLTVFQAALLGSTQKRGMCVIRGHPATPAAKDIFAFTHADFLHKDGWKGQLHRIGDATHWEYAQHWYKPPLSHVKMPGGIAIPVQDDNNHSDEDGEDLAQSAAEQLEEAATHFKEGAYTNNNITFRFQRKAKGRS